MQMAPVQAVFLQASYTDVGFLMGFARNILYVLLSPFTMTVLSKMNWSWPLRLSAVLMTTAHILVYMANELTMLLLSQLVTGIAFFFFFPCGESIVSTAQNIEKLKAFSLYLSAVSAGFLFGSLLAGYVASLFGIKNLFLTASVISAFATAILSKINFRGKVDKSEESRPVLDVFKPVFLAAPYFIILSAAYSVIPSYLVKNLVSEFNLGMLFFALMLARVMTSYFLSKIDTNHARMTLAISNLLLVAFFILSGFMTSNYSVYLITFITIGAAVSTSYTLTLYQISTTNTSKTFYFIGIFEMLIGSCFLTGPLIAGFVIDVYGINVLNYFFACMAGVSLFFSSFRPSQR